MFRLRTSAAACALALAPMTAFAQTGHLRFDAATLAATAQSAPQAPAGQSGSATARPLSMDEAVRLALEQNLGIRIQRIDPQIQDTGVAQSRSFWSPTLGSSFSRVGNNYPATSIIQPAYNNGTTNANISLSQTLPWGGSYTAGWINQRLTTTNILQNYSPQLYSNVQFNYTQPLMRNFSIDQIRQQVKQSQKFRELSDIQLQAVVTSTERGVRDAYWDLVYAISNQKVQQLSLELSQQFLKDNQKRVEIGTLAPIDIVQAQAEVASNEQGVIVADAAIKTAQDNLRALILDPGQPDFWNVEFDPTDAASFAAQSVDVDAAVRNALDKRTDLQAAKNTLAVGDINMKFLKNQLLPDVNLQANYGALSYGGTQLTSADFTNIGLGIIPARSVISERSYGSVLGDVFTNAYPQWTVGVQVGYPLGSSTVQANMARARLQYQQAQVQVKNLELQIATQVRLAARNVTTNVKRVESARASRELQEKKLDAEEKKLAAGMSQSFFVFQAQRDLAVARVAEIQAISDYNKSLVDFDAVQMVPLNGAFPGITTPGSGAIVTGNSAIIRAQ
ncbi:MAG TPA: TolC family protein [Vicinamibacterales bacterium]|nr:TolC family protein [Vicinamibacterales bacterium]